MPPDLTGSVCLVTGASSGIGRETARALARTGATVVGVSRGSGKGAETAEALRRETGNEAVHFLPADLSSMTEVRRLAEDFKGRFNTLEVLVNDAGALFSARRTTVDGFEATFALNHLSYFLLTHLLLEPLARSPAARIVNVSSQAERFGRMHDDLMLQKGYSGWRAYSQSKLANLLFSYSLARRLEHTPVTVNALHPGGVASGFGADSRGLGALFLRAVRPFFKTPEEGARTAVYLATSGEVAGVSGGYFMNEKPASSSTRSHDREAQARLWRESERLVQLSEAEAAPLRGLERAA